MSHKIGVNCNSQFFLSKYHRANFSQTATSLSLIRIVKIEQKRNLTVSTIPKEDGLNSLRGKYFPNRRAIFPKDRKPRSTTTRNRLRN